MNGLVHNLLMQFSNLGSSTINVSETSFFDIVATQNDHPRSIKHVLGNIYVFSPYLGIESGGGGVKQGLVHNLLVQFFTLRSSNVGVFETYCFDIVTTQIDNPRYLKHFLARIYVVFTLFWVCVAWGRFSARWTC